MITQWACILMGCLLIDLSLFFGVWYFLGGFVLLIAGLFANIGHV